MIVDSSALLSVVFREEGHEAYLERLLEEAASAIGTPTLVETGIVLTARLGPAARGLLERLIDELDLAVLDSVSEQGPGFMLSAPVKMI